MPPERRRPHAPAPSPPDEDQTGWLLTFSDLVLQLFAFVLVSAVLVGAAQAPKAAVAAAPAPPCAAEPVRPPIAAGADAVRVAVAAPAPDVTATGEAEDPAAPPSSAAAVLTSAERTLRELVAAEGRDDAVHVAVRDADLVVTLSDTITFPSASAELLPAAAPILRHIGVLARSMPAFDVEVGGHTDDVPIRGGGFPSNLELSLARAARVVHELSAEAPELVARTVAAGYGEHRPVASNADEQGRAQNRRVEIRLVPRPTPRG